MKGADMFGKKPGVQKTIDSLIGAGTQIEGSLSFQGGLRIDGTVIGDVCAAEGAQGMLVISEQASIRGTVRAAHIVVSGEITGPIYATEVLELQPKARIRGDVHYKGLEMHHGAIVHGTLVHGDPGAVAPGEAGRVQEE
jgi:cytoskeletal protein CcmA (bactofilin family)